VTDLFLHLYNESVTIYLLGQDIRPYYPTMIDKIIPHEIKIFRVINGSAYPGSTGIIPHQGVIEPLNLNQEFRDGYYDRKRGQTMPEYSQRYCERRRWEYQLQARDKL